MEIKRQYLEKYLHDIAIDQLAADYIANGYDVAKEKPVGKYRADLVAQKGSEVVVIEVKAGRMTSERRSQISAIADYVKDQPDYKFLVVLANPPIEKKIEIPNIKQILFDYFREHIPDKLNDLPAQTLQRITSVENAVVDEVTVDTQGDITAKGHALLNVTLRYSSAPHRHRKNRGAIIEETFPFDFKIVLTHSSGNELTLSEVIRLNVDVSDWYE